MASLATIQTDLRSCAEAYNTAAGDADRTARHTISEVSAASGLTPHTLRWYERIGLLDPIDRSHAGQRRYSDADLTRLAFLGRLRLTGMPVADMLRYVELARAGDGTRAARRDILVAHREEVRERLADLHATLAVLDYKIDIYTDRADQAENADQADRTDHAERADHGAPYGGSHETTDRKSA
ncbi:hypothetical protein GCM10010441_16130 [Kitasatospora paracochleata]|uniref:DNA-binding transcriptional MerR regulator n=1 Tax=Kitasatospora paracochleata TaxID=58354 RepID=A0ABT1IZD3_9ACTN|nr:DNA-binding transcriptional MerR regulator [Kitasatospora paracochleata]